MRHIRNRYIGMQRKIAEQVKLLQLDERFLARCERYYQEGYKDWHILAAIYNLVANKRGQELKIELRTREAAERFKEAAKNLKGVVYPAEDFLTPELDFMFVTHALTCLLPYGFEERGVGLKAQPVIKFLRERMKHYELDIPHAPMFGLPPADWPKLNDDD